VTTPVRTRSKQETAHRASVDYTVQDVARVLQEHLGRKLTVYIAGVEDPKAASEWAKGTRTPQPEAERRLRAALQVFSLLLAEDSAHTARAWMIGMNPQLGDDAPADVLREGRLKDVLSAAKAYIVGG
jgi:hypothetical protein